MHTKFGNPPCREDEDEDEDEGKQNPVVRVVQFRGALENLSDCSVAP